MYLALTGAIKLLCNRIEENRKEEEREDLWKECEKTKAKRGGPGTNGLW